MRNFYYALTMLVIVVSALFVGGCSSDEYGNEEEATEAQVAALKTRVLEIAAEYGLDNYVVDDAMLRKNISMSDAQIEKEMQMLASISGTYQLRKNGENTLRIGRKLSKRALTRSGGDYELDGYPETIEDKYGANGKDKGTGGSISGDFNYGYSQDGTEFGNDYIDGSFKVSFEEEQDDGTTRPTSYDAEIVEEGAPVFFGDMSHLSMKKTFTIKVTTSTGVIYYDVVVIYTYGDDNGEMIIQNVRKG